MSAFSIQLTGPGMGAIAVIALFGDDAHAILTRFTTPKTIDPLTIGKFSRVTLRDPATHTPIDDALLIQTDTHAYELHIHGGTAVVTALLQALTHAGAPQLSLQDALHQNLFGNLLHSEILTALPAATTLPAARLLAAQSTEGLTAWSRHWQQELTHKSPNDLWHFHSAVQWLQNRSLTLQKLLHPARIAIIGPPNAGKSTLANALLGRPAAITSDTPGTTRDWIDAPATVLHHHTPIPVTLIDTAGIRPTTDLLEQTSITRTHEQAAQADLILLLFDGSRPPSTEELQSGQSYPPSRTIAVANKADAGSAGLDDLHRLHPTLLQVSAKESLGLNPLMNAVIEKLDLALITPTEPFAFTPRQHHLLQQLAMTGNATAAALLLSALASSNVRPL
jgi:tRNA modification GTPase